MFGWVSATRSHSSGAGSWGSLAADWHSVWGTSGDGTPSHVDALGESGASCWEMLITGVASAEVGCGSGSTLDSLEGLGAVKGLGLL